MLSILINEVSIQFPLRKHSLLITLSAALLSTFAFWTLLEGYANVFWKFVWEIKSVFDLYRGIDMLRQRLNECSMSLEVLTTHLPLLRRTAYRASNVIKSSLWSRLVCCRNLPLIASRYGVFRESVCCACNEEPLTSRTRKHIKELPGGLQRPICPGNFALERLNP